MAYSSLTNKDIEEKFGRTIKGCYLFKGKPIQNIEPSAWLVETIQRGRKLGLGSEKSRSERFVNPVLTEMHQICGESFCILSGMNLDVDMAKGLIGKIDFLFSYSQVEDIVKAPIFTVTEAKKNEIEGGSIECSAQLIAEHTFNEKNKDRFPHLYGCSTTGVEWRFIKLVGNDLYFDIQRYTIYELPELLGVLQFILNEAKEFSKTKV
jgi:hypothetical protein